MKTILIIIVIGYGSVRQGNGWVYGRTASPSVTTVEFQSRAACEAARKAIKVPYPPENDISVIGVCADSFIAEPE